MNWLQGLVFYFISWCVPEVQAREWVKTTFSSPGHASFYSYSAAPLGALFPDGTTETLLEFQLYSNDATVGLYLDNIAFASLENGNFATGNLSAW